MHECRWQGMSPLRHGVPCSGTPRLSACCTASPPLPPLGLLAACGCHSRWLSTSPMSLTARPPQSLLLAALRNRRQRTTSFREEVVRCRRFRSAGEDRIAADAAVSDMGDVDNHRDHRFTTLFLPCYRHGVPCSGIPRPGGLALAARCNESEEPKNKGHHTCRISKTP